MGTFSRWVKAPPKASQSPRAPHSSPQPRHERGVLISTNAILATEPQMYQPELYQGLTIQSKPRHSMTGRPWPSIDGLVLVMVLTMMMMSARAH